MCSFIIIIMIITTVIYVVRCAGLGRAEQKPSQGSLRAGKSVGGLDRLKGDASQRSRGRRRRREEAVPAISL